LGIETNTTTPPNNNNMTKRSITTLSAIAAASIIGGQAFAGTPAKPVKEPLAESCITGDIGFDVTNKYFYHGIRQEDTGFIIQPYANLYFKVYEGAGLINKMTVDVGIWNSFHSDRGLGGTTGNWYEFDFSAGITTTLAERWSLSTGFKYYGSPGDYFGNAYTAAIRLGFDDKDLLGPIALNPYVMVEVELDGKSGNGADEGLYYEVGIRPTVWTSGNFNLALPIAAGFGSNEYYAGDNTYGFFTAGVVATYGLTFIPECLGQWSLSGGASYMHLGEGTSVSNDGEENEWIFTGGLKVAF
jgi:hypothetical protein